MLGWEIRLYMDPTRQRAKRRSDFLGHDRRRQHFSVEIAKQVKLLDLVKRKTADFGKDGNTGDHSCSMARS